MQQLIEHFVHHPALAAGAVLATLIVVVYEVRARAESFAALSTSQAVQLINQGALVIDLRAKDVFDAGHIGDARNVPAAELVAQLDVLKKWRERSIIAYCGSGRDGAGAARTLAKSGFTKVFNLRGGIDGWLKDNMPVVKTAAAGKSGGKSGGKPGGK